MVHTIDFCKMQALGNDFVLIDSSLKPINLSESQIKQLAHRHLGIGFDQLLLIKKLDNKNFRCRIYNSDGSEAEQCGNGLRAVAQFIHLKNLSANNQFVLHTLAGQSAVSIRNDGQITVDMGLPIFEPTKIPFVTTKMQNLYEISLTPALDFSEINIQENKSLSDDNFFATVLSMGNPHCIIQSEQIKKIINAQRVSEDIIMRALGTSKLFPRGVNIGLMEVVDERNIKLRTFERGVGETFACGSNACAAVVAGIINNQLENIVIVHLLYGQLTIEWQGMNSPVKMSGPANLVFEGQINI